MKENDLLEEGKDGNFYFMRGKFDGKSLAYVARVQPGYCAWVLENCSEKISTKARDALQKVVEEAGL